MASYLAPPSFPGTPDVLTEMVNGFSQLCRALQRPTEGSESRPSPSLAPELTSAFSVQHGLDVCACVPPSSLGNSHLQVNRVDAKVRRWLLPDLSFTQPLCASTSSSMKWEQRWELSARKLLRIIFSKFSVSHAGEVHGVRLFSKRLFGVSSHGCDWCACLWYGRGSHSFLIFSSGDKIFYFMILLPPPPQCWAHKHVTPQKA